MQAIICTVYGGPDVLKLREVAVPKPKDNQVRIRVRASTVGPAGTALSRECNAVLMCWRNKELNYKRQEVVIKVHQVE